MRRTLQILCLTLAMLSGAGLLCCAQPRTAGLEFSAFRIGASYRHSAFVSGIEAVHGIELGAEMTGPFMQRTRYPGVYASYGCCFPIVEASREKFVFTLFAGPGILLGWAEDLNSGMGTLLGTQAHISGEFRFRSRPLSIMVGMKPTIGMHLYRTPDSNGRLSVYENGLLSSIIPQIGIAYSFDNQLHGSAPELDSRRRRTARKMPALLSVGAEFGFIAQHHVFSHFNYTAEGGYRVNYEDPDISYCSNGSVLASVGINAGKHLNLALYGGYQGISRRQRIFPLCLRTTVLFGKENAPGRWLCLAGGGIGLKGSPNMFGNAALLQLGWGYRINLAASAKLDLLCSLNGCFWHPDTFSQTVHVRRSNEQLVGLNLGVAFSL